jgi:hypothetical protein
MPRLEPVPGGISPGPSGLRAFRMGTTASGRFIGQEQNNFSHKFRRPFLRLLSLFESPCSFSVQRLSQSASMAVPRRTTGLSRFATADFPSRHAKALRTVRTPAQSCSHAWPARDEQARIEDRAFPPLRQKCEMQILRLAALAQNDSKDVTRSVVRLAARVPICRTGGEPGCP